MGLLDITAVYADGEIPDNCKKIITGYKKKISELEKNLSIATEEKELKSRFSAEQEKINSNLLKN